MIWPPQMTSRDLVPMAGITAALAAAGNATRNRYRERSGGPTGSVKMQMRTSPSRWVTRNRPLKSRFLAHNQNHARLAPGHEYSE